VKCLCSAGIKNLPANHPNNSSVPTAKAVLMGLNNTQEQETWVTVLAEGLVPGFCTIIHYPAAVDTTPVAGRWMWIQHKLFSLYNVRFKSLTKCNSGRTQKFASLELILRYSSKTYKNYIRYNTRIRKSPTRCNCVG
jgi:hypothetical protein